MHFSSELHERADDLIKLFKDTFSDSEGADEGAVISELVSKLLADTKPEDIYVFYTLENDAIVAGVIFTRLTYSEDPRTIFILSPMAVATAQQGKGLGQALINHALVSLRQHKVDVVMTYGDPAFYKKVGFAHVSEADARAPLPLSYPEGWIGQTLDQSVLTSLKGESSCVSALNDPAIW